MERQTLAEKVRAAGVALLRGDHTLAEDLLSHCSSAAPAAVWEVYPNAHLSATHTAELALELNRWATRLEADPEKLAQAVRDAGGGPSEEELAENRKPPRGAKHDSGKPRWTLFPLLAVTRIVDVLEFGAAKYGVDNWRHVDGLRDRYIDAAYRHIAAWRSGETRDPDSGLPHLAHAICSLVFILTIDEEETPTR